MFLTSVNKQRILKNRKFNLKNSINTVLFGKKTPYSPQKTIKSHAFL